MRRIASALGARSLSALIVFALCVAGWLYANETDYREARASEHRRWAETACHPQTAGERTVIERRHDGATQCSRWINAGYGRAPVLVFAEVRE